MKFVAIMALAVFAAMWRFLAATVFCRRMVALFAAFRARRGFAAVIVAIVVFGFGYSFATKPENRNGNPGGDSGPQRSYVPPPSGVVEPIETDIEDIAATTNSLWMHEIYAVSNIVRLGLSWAEGESCDYLDIFGTSMLSTNGWQRLFTVDTAAATNNIAVEFSSVAPAFFYTAADRSDEDGDALTDAEERLVYRTDPSLPETDGDGLDDGGEIAAGILTKCDFRIAC